MNTYAMEQVTRERIAEWHREAQDELLVRSRRSTHPWFLTGPTVARSVGNSGAGRLAFLRSVAARIAAAT